MTSKIALITGGSSGLGAEMARQLGASGYRVILVARNPDRLAKAAQELTSLGISVTTAAADVGDEASMTELAKKLDDDNVTIDFLIANAGAVRVKTLEEYTDLSALKTDINVGLWGAILTAKLLLPRVPEGGRVLFVSSTLGLMGFPGYSMYCAAKGGMIRFAEALRRELKPRKIPVYVAAPADIDTPQYHDEIANLPDWMDASSRSNPMPVDSVARKILKKCCGNRFYILVGTDTWLVFCLFKILPFRLYQYILDKIAPKIPA